MPSYAQNSGSAASSNPAAREQGVNRDAVILRLLSELDAGRAYIAKLEAESVAKAAEIDKLKRAGESLGDAYRNAVLEAGELRGAVTVQKAAVAALEKQLEQMTKRAEKAEKSARFWRKVAGATTLALVIAIKFL